MPRFLCSVILLWTIVASAQQHGINLAWTPSATQGVTTQVICRSTSSGTENCAAPLKTFSDNSTSQFLDTTGQAGVQYYYVLEACINNICSVPSTEATAVFPTVPASPTGVTASPH